MSQALYLVDRTTYAGLLRCVSCERRRCRVHYCPIFAWPRHRAALAVLVHCVLFLCASIRSALDSHASSPYWTPLPLPLFFFCEHGRPHACLVERTPPTLLYFPLRRSHRKRIMFFFDLISAAYTVCVFQPRRIRRRCVAFPSPFAYLRYPWSLLFFFIPIPPVFGA